VLYLRLKGAAGVKLALVWSIDKGSRYFLTLMVTQQLTYTRVHSMTGLAGCHCSRKQVSSNALLADVS
jgi:hypothetical protein